MKKLIATAVLAFTLLSARAEDCITNINVACLNGWTFTVAGYGGTCYNIIESYTNLTCREIMASSCDDGTALIFSQGTNCPSSATDVATVTYTCNTAVYCGMTQGGPNYCASGGHFTINMTGGVSSFVVRLYPGRNICCSMTWCEPFGNDGRTFCMVSTGGGGD